MLPPSPPLATTQGAWRVRHARALSPPPQLLSRALQQPRSSRRPPPPPVLCRQETPRKAAVQCKYICAVKTHAAKRASGAPPSLPPAPPPALPPVPAPALHLPPSPVSSPGETSTPMEEHTFMNFTTLYDNYDDESPRLDTSPFFLDDTGFYNDFAQTHDSNACDSGNSYLPATRSPSSPSTPTPSYSAPEYALAVNSFYNDRETSASDASDASHSLPPSIPTSQPTRLPTPPPPPPSQPRTVAPPPPSQPKRRRAAAASVPKPRAAPLQMTLQMTDDWRNARGGPDILGLAPQSPTFQIRVPEAYRPHVDLRQHHNFRLFVWLKPGRPAKGVIIDQCPHWPTYQLDSSAEHIPSLFENSSPTAEFELWFPDMRAWMGVRRDHLLTLTTGAVFFVRVGHPDWDDVALEAEMKERTPVAKPNIVYGLKEERKHVRGSYAQLRKVGKVGKGRVLDREDEEEEHEVVVLPPRPGKRTQSMALLDLPPPTRPRLMVSTEFDFGNADNNVVTPISPSTVSSADSSRSPSPYYSEPESPSPIPAPLPTPPPPLPPRRCRRRSDKPPPFTEGMFVVDVVAGLLSMQSVELKGMQQAGRFVHVFKKPYVASTYGDQARKWKRASAALRDRYVKAGRTTAGLWTAFSRDYAAELRATGNDDTST
ncbi:hypothetical protein MKEN_00210500 [Mycena kentingensis (nom. inval.)]|nr:hypothetical protein MKEN_00210500 [Mycena kentingensis (nom. inval.)]